VAGGLAPGRERRWVGQQCRASLCLTVGRDVVWDNNVVPHCASQHAQLLTGFRRAYCLQNQGASLKRRSTSTTLHGTVSQNTDAHLHLVLSLRMHGVIHPRPHTPSWRSANVRAAVCSEPRTLHCCSGKLRVLTASW
jgi:hypothetical protein